MIVEQSPAVGRALGTLLTQGGAAYLAQTQGSPFLVIAYEATVIVVWFASGPLIGFREAAMEAAQTVGRAYFEALFQSVIERRERRANR